MDSQQNLLIIAWLFVSFMIWQTWEQDKNMSSQQNILQNITTGLDFNNEKAIPISNQDKRIKIKTDVLELTVNTNGGDIEQAWLLTYPKKLKSKEPFQLLRSNSEFVYQAQSGITGRDGPDNPINGHRPIYSVDKDLFVLNDKQNKLIVPMYYKDINGNSFTKIFVLKRNEYALDISHIIHNCSNRMLELSAFGQLKQSINIPSHDDAKNSNFTLHTFRGTAYSTSKKKYEKCSFNDIINNEDLNIKSKGGWVAMLQQYFAVAWVPANSNDEVNNFYTRNFSNGIVAIGYKSQLVSVKPNQTRKLQSRLWIGPEIQDKMADVAPYLDLTVDYGWLWFISQPLFKLLKFIYTFLGNWGYSIVIITLIVRVITYPLTKAQYISIARMRTLQPKIQAIKDLLGEDKRRISQEIIKLYKAEKVNPLGGCFPLLIQMPIFLALYYMLIGSVELRHASFILWIQDLSAQDPYYILPILMSITIYIIQKMSPNTVTDQIQQKIMNFMPVFFTIFFLWFPSGLVLYYIVSNLLTIIQQQLIYHSLKKNGLHSI